MREFLNYIKRLIFFDTYGALATAAFLICIVSGVVIALPFNPDQPFESISGFMTGNPPMSLFRNIHYWSAQLFLILILLHIWDHFKQNSEQTVRKGIWFRLTLSVLFTFYVMLSGFILKGDADSLQAKRILDDLLRRIPVGGNMLAYLFIGPEGNFRILYMQHITTATIFLVIVTFEHARKIWVRWDTFGWVFLVVLVLSLFIQAPLHDMHDPVIKGPWYFTGLQEILHWLKHPGWTLILITGLLILIWQIPTLGNKTALVSKRILLYTFFVYCILTVIGFWFRGENWKWRVPWNEMRQNSNKIQVSGGLFRSLIAGTDSSTIGNPVHEGCLRCHSGLKGFSPAHDPETIGCSACHLGNAFTTDKQAAHRGMMLVPGNLDDTYLTCGTENCHPNIHRRMKNTLMTTLSGLVTVDKYVFGEEDDLSAGHHIHELDNRKPSAAEAHLTNLCASCHLGNPKTRPGPVTATSRGGGCNACHLNYNDTTLSEWDRYQKTANSDLFPKTHPTLSLRITNDHCFGCHSRSGRISTNYEGWHETNRESSDTAGLKRYRIIEGSRVFRFVSADIHHQKGMECIDCHNAYELMGSDTLYRHEEDQVTIRCEDCHNEKPSKKIASDNLDPLYTKIAELRDIHSDSFYTEQISGLPLLQLVDQKDSIYLRTKNKGKLLPLRSPAKECTRDKAHSRLSCSACHTAWAPSCIGCHNSWEANTPGYDLYRQNKPVTGTWVEYVGIFNADPPALGVRKLRSNEKSSEKIIPGIPGMILSIDLSEYSGKKTQDSVFHRLFAPAEPHTTAAKGRSCRSCHNNPQALGFGKGKLTYNIDDHVGHWTFIPYYDSEPVDGLPADAWTGFLKEDTTPSATRLNFRPFTVEEQKRILTVGACLICHEENSTIMKQSLADFPGILKQLSQQCILPAWMDDEEIR